MEINIKSVDDGKGKWTTAIDAPDRARIVDMIQVFEACINQVMAMGAENQIPDSLFEEMEFQDIDPN